MPNRKELRFELRVKNNILYHAIMDSGSYTSIHDFCKKERFNAGRVGALLNLKLSPVRENGEFISICVRLAHIFGFLCEELFPLYLYTHKKAINCVVREVSWEDAQAFLSTKVDEQTVLPDEIYSQKELQEQIQRVLGTLTVREEQIVKLLYGVGSEALSRKEVAEKFGVGEERVRMILQRALRKLRKRSRRVLLEELLVCI